MDFDNTVRMLGLKVLPHTRFACLYLQEHGFRFCVDFGYANATEKARAHWQNRKCKRLKAKLRGAR